MTSGGEEEKTKHEEDDLHPNIDDLVSKLGFLFEDAAEAIEPEVAASYKKVARTLATQFRQDLKASVNFLHLENQITREEVVKGMKAATAEFKEGLEIQEERMKQQVQKLEAQYKELEERLSSTEGTSGRPRRLEGPKPSKPDNFDGNRAKGKAWLRTIRQYLELRPYEFTSDSVTIGWVLSFFKEGRADSFAQEAYDFREKNEDKWKWNSLTEFFVEFRKEFYEQESETVAFLKLEGTEYFQGKRTVSDYCDLFRNLVREAGLTDRRVIVSKFRRGLRKDVDDVVSRDIGLVLDDPDLWYTKAKDHELVAKFNKAYHESQNSSRGTYQYRTSTTSTTSTTPITSPAPSKPASEPTTPRSTTSTSKFSSRLNCWNCGKEGHTAWQCSEPKPEGRSSIKLSDLADEDVLALANIGLEVIEEESKAEEGF